jgi:hypothetical protein
MSRDAPPSLDSLRAVVASDAPRQAPPSLDSLQTRQNPAGVEHRRKPPELSQLQRAPTRTSPPALNTLQRAGATPAPAPQPNAMMAMHAEATEHMQVAGGRSSGGCKQRLGLDQTERPPVLPIWVALCCCCCGGWLPCAHLIARPSDLTTTSFLGLLAYCEYDASILRITIHFI